MLHFNILSKLILYPRAVMNYTPQRESLFIKKLRQYSNYNRLIGNYIANPPSINTHVRCLLIPGKVLHCPTENSSLTLS